MKLRQGWHQLGLNLTIFGEYEMSEQEWFEAGGDYQEEQLYPDSDEDQKLFLSIRL